MYKLTWEVVVLAFALLLAATLSRAQDAPQADVAVEYSHVLVLKGYTISMNGGGGSAAFNLNHWFGLAADVGVYHGYPGESLTGETYTFGSRFTYRRFHLLQPFAQALFGGSHFSANSGGITGGGIEFAFPLGLGVDIALGHRKKFAVRLQRDYFFTRQDDSPTILDRLSAGIVYRIGEK